MSNNNGKMKFIVIVCVYLFKSGDSQEYGETLDLLMDRNNVSTIEEFLQGYVTLDSGGHPNTSQLIDVWLSGQEGDKAVVTGERELATPDLCLPREVSVELPKPEGALNPQGASINIFPPCTRVLRCGGCCNSPLQQCEPHETVLKDLWAVQHVLPYPGSPSFQRPTLVAVQVEEHRSCACKCRVKKENCTPMQEYFSQICACLCINRKQARHCPAHKPWDSSSCSCRCPDRERTVCEEDKIYNENSCSCSVKAAVSGTVDPVIILGGGDSGDTDSGGIEIKEDENLIDNQSSSGTKVTSLDNGTTTTIASSQTSTTTTTTMAPPSITNTISTSPTTRTTTTPATILPPKKLECIPRRPCPPKWIPKLMRNKVCSCRPPPRKTVKG